MAVEKHQCPRPGCILKIDNRLFSCAAHWFELTMPCRNRIGATSRMNVLQGPRRRAIEQAMEEWRAIDAARAN